MVAMRPVAGAGAGARRDRAARHRVGHRGHHALRVRRAGRATARRTPFRLVAHGPDGATEQIGSWLAAPGDDVRFTGATRFTDAELVRLELLRGRRHTPVLTYDVR